MGIFAVAGLAQLSNKHVHVLSDPIRVISTSSVSFELDTVIHYSLFKGKVVS
jgi:hypothetical protein